jgi:plastocyanin
MLARRCLLKRVLSLALAGMACAVLAAGARAEDAAAPAAAPAPAAVTADGPVVKIENFTFNPAELTVKPGTVVTFLNADDIPHSVVDKEHKFKSKPLDTGDKFTMTFADAGEISYFCGFHPHMVGKIIVKP